MIRRFWVLGVVGLIIAIIGGGLLAYGLWSNSELSGRFVSAKNAQVVADMVQVGSLNAGRIVVIDLEVGDPVLEGQVIAIVEIPAVVSRSQITDTSKIGFRDVQDQRTEVVAPRSGVIAARWVKIGDTVPAGQPIVTLMDQRTIWIEADIDQGKIGRVRPGQAVEVEIPGRDGRLAGRVETVSPVTAATLSPEPARSSSRNSPQVAQVIPIIITLDDDRLLLIPGSEAKIKIWIP